MKIERYGIYLADLNPARGAEMKKVRPVVIASVNAMNDALETVVVCPLTTVIHARWRSRIQIRCAGKEAEIAVDQIRCISKTRLTKKLASLNPAAADELRRCISELYGDG